jgi:hypothetical protein
MRRPAYRSAVHLVLERSAVPYGYTLTVWSSGAMLMHRHGAPPPLDVFLFLGGGALAFAVLVLAAGRLVPAEPLAAGATRIKATGALQLVSVAAAVAVADLAAQISGQLAWLVGSFAATATFLLLVSLGLSSVPGE